MKRLLALALLSLSGCGGSHTATAPSSANESYVVERVGYWAGQLGVVVTGVITDQKNTYGCDQYGAGCYDAGWFSSGKAYFYRPWVNEQSLENLSDSAAHEVCHAEWPFHDSHHWCCMQKLSGHPTYAPPVQNMVCS